MLDDVDALRRQPVVVDQRLPKHIVVNDETVGAAVDATQQRPFEPHRQSTDVGLQVMHTDHETTRTAPADERVGEPVDVVNVSQVDVRVTPISTTGRPPADIGDPP